jgi:hypothetical protein
MFPLFPSALWMKIGVAIALCTLMYFLGYSHEHKKFMAYKTDIAALGKAQELLNAALTEKHELISTSIKGEYEDRLAAVHNYYADRVRDTSSSPMPAVSKPAKCPVATTTDNVSARQCAETTLMLTELQKWVKGVTNAK